MRTKWKEWERRGKYIDWGTERNYYTGRQSKDMSQKGVPLCERETKVHEQDANCPLTSEWSITSGVADASARTPMQRQDEAEKPALQVRTNVTAIPDGTSNGATQTPRPSSQTPMPSSTGVKRDEDDVAPLAVLRMCVASRGKDTDRGGWTRCGWSWWNGGGTTEAPSRGVTAVTWMAERTSKIILAITKRIETQKRATLTRTGGGFLGGAAPPSAIALYVYDTAMDLFRKNTACVQSQFLSRRPLSKYFALTHSLSISPHTQTHSCKHEHQQQHIKQN